MNHKSRLTLVTLGALLILSGCQRDKPSEPIASVTQTKQTTITVGDIDKEDPAARKQRIRPLANFLGRQLGAAGIERSDVKIAPDIVSMARLLKDGVVDVYIDSPYPVLAANRIADSQSILLNQALNDATYQSVFIVRSDSDISKLRDLLGKVVAFQAPHSTSGFLLPAAYIMEAGYQLRAVPDGGGQMSASHIGCTFSGDEIKTTQMVLAGTAAAGAISNQDLAALSPEQRDQVKVIAKTYHVPRQLVAVRKDMHTDLKTSLYAVLVAITDDQRVDLAAQDGPLGWTWNFAPLTDNMLEQLNRLKAKIDRLPDCA